MPRNWRPITSRQIFVTRSSAIALKTRVPDFGPRSATAQTVRGVAAAALPIAGPVSTAPPRAQGSTRTLAFLNLLGDFVASLTEDATVAIGPEYHGDRPDAQTGGDAPQSKAKKPEGGPAPKNASPVDLLNGVATAAAPEPDAADRSKLFSAPGHAGLSAEIAATTVEGPTDTAIPLSAPDAKSSHTPMQLRFRATRGKSSEVSRGGPEMPAFQSAVPADAPAPFSPAAGGEREESSAGTLRASLAPEAPPQNRVSPESAKESDLARDVVQFSAVHAVAVPAPAPPAPPPVRSGGWPEIATGKLGTSNPSDVPRQPGSLAISGKRSEVSRDWMELPLAQPAVVPAAAPLPHPPAASGGSTEEISAEILRSELQAGKAADPIPQSADQPHPGAPPRGRERASGFPVAPRSRETNDSVTTLAREPVGVPAARDDVAQTAAENDALSGAPHGDSTTPPIAGDPPRETTPSPLAFAARLAPAAPPEIPISSPVTSPANPAPSIPTTAPKPAEESASVPSGPRVHKAEPPGESGQEPSPEPRDGAVTAPARVAEVASPIAPRQETRLESHAAGQAPSRPAEAAHAPAERPPAVEPTARDIRLELAGPGRRVEVRLEERAGEVRVSVRTPDGALADTLRDHLPALSERLEQNGFRADQWRAADGSGGTRPLEVQRLAGGSTSEGRQQQTGRGDEQSPQQQSGRQREPREEGRPVRNQKGKSFAWLMSSLR